MDQDPPPIPVPLHIDIISLMGRISKDRSEHDRKLLPVAIEWYRKAAAVPGAEAIADGGTFPIINMATLHRLNGAIDEATRLAMLTIERATPCAADNPDDHNLHATLGEACLLLGRHAEAGEHYLKAIALARNAKVEGTIIAMRRNLHRLEKAKATEPVPELEAHIGCVVIHSGHMIDQPGRETTRFPPNRALENLLRREMDSRLQAMNAKVGYSSLTCGSDIVFAEAMLAREAELHVMLPFGTDDFLLTSVTFGYGDAYWQSWRTRFEDVLKKVNDAGPERIHYATKEPFLQTNDLYQQANALTQGLAILRARERVATPRALIVRDKSSEVKKGGAQDFLKVWKDAGYQHDEHDEIDLADLRDKAGAFVAPPVPSERTALPAETSPLTRTRKAVLFADIEGYSRIPEKDLARFLTGYADLLRDVFAHSVGQASQFANTWGDGIYAVFDRVTDAAAFALALIDPAPLIGRGWASLGLATDTPLRVALHYGPVFEVQDHFQNRKAYSGQHVSRAARIEPVTMPGCVYVSEPFAAALTVATGHPFRCEYVGQHELHKGYDRCGLYQLHR